MLDELSNQNNQTGQLNVGSIPIIQPSPTPTSEPDLGEHIANYYSK